MLGEEKKFLLLVLNKRVGEFMKKYILFKEERMHHEKYNSLWFRS